MPMDTFANSGWYRQWGKRTLDVVISAFGLLLLLPLIAMVGLAVRIFNRTRVLFIQPRPGLNERVFRMFKFCTMTDARDESGELLPDKLRVTRLGSFLRETSLDELPELWNVLKGDMSIVGPRPLLVEYLPHYSPEQRLRHSTRPGMTGLAQVNGRNQTTWEERLAWDVHYIEQCSLALDLRVIARTFIVLFRSDGGIEAVGTLGKFRGTTLDVDVENPAEKVK